MKSRAELVSDTKQTFGDDYSQYNWFGRESARHAEEDRHRLLDSLPSDIDFSFKQSKLQFGALSPGCSICGEGEGASLFLDAGCPSSCFFCPYDKSKHTEDSSPLAWGGIPYDDPHDFVEFLKIFDIKGVAFTGGEPFLCFERLVDYLKAIRTLMPREVYVWVYTGGSIVDKCNLRQLKELGLDEIRFNICATDYDLTFLKMARGEIPKVAVEIPVIPEEINILKETFHALDRLKVDFVNLHQLTTTRHNASQYAQRNYTLLHQSANPVFESEMAVLTLLKYSREKELSFPIHYCSAVYKRRFQDLGMRRKAAAIVKKGFEEVTRLGYLRSLTMKEDSHILNEHIKNFENMGFAPDLWQLSTEKGELHLHSRLIKKMNPNDSQFILRYIEPQLHSEKNHRKDIALSVRRTLSVSRQLVFEAADLSGECILALADIWVKPLDLQEIVKKFCENYQIQTAQEIQRMLREKQACMQAAFHENLEEGLEKII